MELASAIAAWRSRLGDQSVLLAPEAQAIYGACTTGVERTIPAALRPWTDVKPTALRPGLTDEVAAILDIARRHAVPLYPISTGHNWGYGSANPVKDGCVVLDLSGLKGMAMDAELGLVTLEPGVTQQDLAAYLDTNGNQFLVPVTGAGPTCSLIGNALERGYGITPYADHFGAVTALEAVLPNGRIYRSALSELGGEEVDRAFKWGMGPYLDGLFAQGAFGIVTRMTIALAPRPQRIEAFLFGIREDAGLEPAVAAIQQALRAVGGVAGSINLMNARRMLSMTIPYPKDRAGGAGIMADETVAELARDNRVMAWTGFGALYGSAPVVKAARKVVRRILKPAVSQLVFLTPPSVAWLNRCIGKIPRIRDGSLARQARLLNASLQLVAGRPSQVALPLAYWRSGTAPPPGRDMDPARDGCGLIWYPPLVPMRPKRVRRYTQMVVEVCAAHGIEPLITLTSLSDRCFDSSVPLLFDRHNPEDLKRARDCYQALLEAGKKEGFLPYRLNVDSMEWMTGSQTPFWELVGAVKNAIDPSGIIAPGRYASMTR